MMEPQDSKISFNGSHFALEYSLARNKSGICLRFAASFDIENHARETVEGTAKITISEFLRGLLIHYLT